MLGQMARGMRHARGRRFSPHSVALLALLAASVALLMLLDLGLLSFPVAPDAASRPHRSVFETTDGEMGGRTKQWTEVLSWEPRAFLYHNFLSKEECDHLIKVAKPHMRRSKVVNVTTGQGTDTRARTSSGTFLRKGQDKIIQAIEKRIADFTFIPVENGEGLQVLHYGVGEKYEHHPDFFLDEFNTKNGGQRVATVLMYLSDVEEGGETVFTSVNVNGSSLPRYNKLSQCGKTGLAVRPKMGNALLFWSMKPDTSLDPLSVHRACPVIKGNKWACTKWMRMYEYIQHTNR